MIYVGSISLYTSIFVCLLRVGRLLNFISPPRAALRANKQ